MLHNQTNDNNKKSRLYKKENKMFFGRLDPSFLRDNNLWESIKSFLLDEQRNPTEITFTENELVISDSVEVAI